MKIKWLGHSSFMITSDAGTKIITDPYAPTDKLRYGKIKESADIITISHEHPDHNNTDPILGNPSILRQSPEVKGINFKAILAYHDNDSGTKKGSSTIFWFEVDRVKICHLGDIGHLLSDKQLMELDKVDLLLIPVGGYYTIDAEVASKICDQIKPGVIIPMHFLDSRSDLPISGVDGFLQGKNNVNRLNSSELKLKIEEIPIRTQIMVLTPAL
jgi:L-ascorbate metabolism protein UlaG (beta-lactamase superfamily)